MLDLSKIATCKLVEELRKREGVKTIDIQPYVGYEISVAADGDDSGNYVNDNGPAVLMVVID